MVYKQFFPYREAGQNDLLTKGQEQAAHGRQEEKGGATAGLHPRLPDSERASCQPEPADRPLRWPEESQCGAEAKKRTRAKNVGMRCDYVVKR